MSLKGFRNLSKSSSRESKLRIKSDLEVFVKSMEDVNLILGFEFEMV